MREIYFDNSATTKQLNSVIRVMVHTAEKFYGNPSSLHSLGYEAEKELRRNRQIFSDLLNCDEKEIVFTSGGSESNNLALIGYARANPRKGNHILVTETEHPSVLECAKYLSDNGYNVEYIPVDRKGVPDLEWIRDKVKEKTVLVSVHHVNSETDSILPIKEICKIVKGK
ncbi:MAG TPA: aminotransferase class V-fold PLP-dependent enzyme, partial [Clostridia bacterium]|nr:aminotransferase class V-fold PLP-dependent enzyme [Clostridia bacterium]